MAPPTLPLPRPGAVIFAKHLQPLARFYAAVLCWPQTQADAQQVVLACDAMELVLHAIPPHIAEGIVLSQPPVAREDTALKLFFPVASLAEARARAAAHGGLLGPAESEWSGPGFRACEGLDPEGNVLQLREPAP